jgi:protein disulfide-isomerase A6
LTPEFAAAAKVLKTGDKVVALGKCDATVHTKAAEPFDIKGFPTLKFFNKGNVIDFNGGRTSAEIV